MPKDSFENAVDSLIAPAKDCFSITPSDAGDLAQITKAIYVGTGGDVTLRAQDGTADILFRNLQDGSILDVRVRAVRETGTSAADIVGLV